MGMPNNLVLVRHGESEANLAQKLQKEGKPELIPEEFWNRHDWEHRLTAKGVEQAKLAGRWITENIGPIDEYFDRRYVSPFIRTRETALNLGELACDADFLKDDRLIERSWGTYGAVPLGDRADLFAHTEVQRRQSSLYAQFDNGESIGYNTIYRARDWFGSLHRDMSGKNVMAVTHGEFMWSARYVLDNMLPEDWDKHDKDRTQSIRNCTILDYTRVNPETGEVFDALKWLRIIYPDNPEQSPLGGEWQMLPGKRYLGADDLAQAVNSVPNIFEEASIK